MTKELVRAGNNLRAGFRNSKPDHPSQNVRHDMAAALEEALRMRPCDFVRARAHTMLGQLAQAPVYESVLGDTEALGLMMSLLDDGAAGETKCDRDGLAQHRLREISG